MFVGVVEIHEVPVTEIVPFTPRLLVFQLIVGQFKFGRVTEANVPLMAPLNSWNVSPGESMPPMFVTTRLPPNVTDVAAKRSLLGVAPRLISIVVTPPS